MSKKKHQTEKDLQAMREHAKKTILRADVMEKTKKINRERMKGSTLPDETKKKISENGKFGNENNQWKGNSASNVAKHYYARLHKEGPRICVDYDPHNPYGCSKRLEISNKDHLHSRNMDDWEWRCTRHHREYEWRYGLINPTGKAMRFVEGFGNMHLRSITLDGIIIEEKEVTTNYL